MRSKGFSWIDPVPASTSGEASPGQDEAFVAKFGYGILSGPTDPAEPDPIWPCSTCSPTANRLPTTSPWSGTRTDFPRSPRAVASVVSSKRLFAVRRCSNSRECSERWPNSPRRSRRRGGRCPGGLVAVHQFGGLRGGHSRRLLMEDFRRLAEVPMSDAQRSQAVQREIATASADLRCSAAIEAAVSAARRRVNSIDPRHVLPLVRSSCLSGRGRATVRHPFVKLGPCSWIWSPRSPGWTTMRC